MSLALKSQAICYRTSRIDNNKTNTVRKTPFLNFIFIDYPQVFQLSKNTFKINGYVLPPLIHVDLNVALIKMDENATIYQYVNLYRQQKIC